MPIPKHAIQHLGRIPFYHHRTPSTLTLCFIPGFRSSFQASLKSDHLYHWAQQHNMGFLTWDHDVETSIQDWCQQGQDIITSQLLSPLANQIHQNDRRAEQKILFVGASLGTWLAIRIVQGLMMNNNNNSNGSNGSIDSNNSMTTSMTPNTLMVAGLIGIGGSVDSTERWLQELNSNTTTPSQIVLDGGVRFWRRPSKYAAQGYYDIPISFLEDSRPSLLFAQHNDITDIRYPIHLIHGVLDQDVPLVSVHQLLAWIRSRQSMATAHLHLIKDGDHRLSRPEDLDLLDKVLITCSQDGY